MRTLFDSVCPSCGVLACGGTWLVAPALLAETRFDRIETLTREAVEIAARVQAGAAA